jgi:hypothetical protein
LTPGHQQQDHQDGRGQPFPADYPVKTGHPGQEIDLCQHNVILPMFTLGNPPLKWRTLGSIPITLD